MKLLGWIAAAVLGTAAFAAGAEEASAPEQKTPAIGKGTDALLALQRNNQRPGKPLGVPAVEAAPAQARYLDSFKTPIPDHLLPPGGYGEPKQ